MLDYEQLEKQIFKKPFKLSRAAYLEYMDSVKGNEDISMDEAMRKLNRNILLSNPDKFYEDEGIQNFIYGRLRIRVDRKSHRIMAVKNLYRYGLGRKWKKDLEKYNELNRKLKIVPDMVITQ